VLRVTGFLNVPEEVATTRKHVDSGCSREALIDDLAVFDDVQRDGFIGDWFENRQNRSNPSEPVRLCQKISKHPRIGFPYRTRH
jgi:hypothetical protein